MRSRRAGATPACRPWIRHVDECLHLLPCVEALDQPVQDGDDGRGAGGRRGVLSSVSGVAEERVADGAHGLGGLDDHPMGGAGFGGGAWARLPPVELDDDPGERGAQFVGQLAGQLLLVPQHGAYAVQQSVQRGTQTGEFDRMVLDTEAFVGTDGAPLGGLVGHGPYGAQRSPDGQARQRVGAREHDGIQDQGTQQQCVGRTPVRPQVQRRDHSGAVTAAHEIRAQAHGVWALGVDGRAGPLPLCGEPAGGPGQRTVRRGGRRLLQHLGPGVDPRVGVEEVVVDGLHDPHPGTAGVDGRGDGSRAVAQFVVRLVLQVPVHHGVERNGQHGHQERGGGQRHEGEPAAQGAGSQAAQETVHDSRCPIPRAVVRLRSLPTSRSLRRSRLRY